MTHATRVLGVDPGLTRCGVAVIEGSAGQKVSLLHIGVFRTDPGEAIEQRLISIERDIDGLVDELEPDVVAVERVFSQHNVRTAMATACRSGRLLVAAAEDSVAMHTPTEVKAAVTGNGRADKAQVTAMVTLVLRLDIPPNPADAADAAAIAICHAWRGVATQRLERARREMTSQRSSGTSTQQAAAARR